MNRRLMISIGLFSLLYTVLLASCATGSKNLKETDDNDLLKGWLVYTNGGGDIRALNLETGKDKLIYKSKNWVLNISEGEKREIFFDACSGDCLIKKYDLDNKEVQTLFSGQAPLYVKKHNALFFYRKDQFKFYQRSRRSGNDRWEEIKITYEFPKSNGLRIHPIQISPDEILIYTDSESIIRFNLNDKTFSSVKVKNCIPKVWLDQHNSLLCFNRENEAYELVSFPYYERKKINIEVLRRGVVYSPNLDSLIYSSVPTFTLIESYYLYSTDLNTFHTKKLGPGILYSGFWVEGLNLK